MDSACPTETGHRGAENIRSQPPPTRVAALAGAAGGGRRGCLPAQTARDTSNATDKAAHRLPRCRTGCAPSVARGQGHSGYIIIVRGEVTRTTAALPPSCRHSKELHAEERAATTLPSRSPCHPSRRRRRRRWAGRASESSMSMQNSSSNASTSSTVSRLSSARSPVKLAVADTCSERPAVTRQHAHASDSVTRAGAGG